MTEPREPSLDQLAAGVIDEIDADILLRTAELFDALDPVPAGLIDRINFGLTLDALHAEIAELQRSASLAGVRAEVGSEVQTVTFSSACLTTAVTITPVAGDRARIDGWIEPGAGVEVELRTAEQTFSVTADEDGRFVFEDVPRGFAQFVLRRPGSGAAPVVTPSIDI
jgi:hypothetical protein